jgi:hypothetical protein
MPILEQRNIYKCEPSRAWVNLSVFSPTGDSRQCEFLVDTGNPCPLIVGSEFMIAMRWRTSAGIESNFGSMDAGWLSLAVPEFGSEFKTICYANDIVLNVVRRSKDSFAGLVGLPLLRMMEFGGDQGYFWVRPIRGD